jgi:hypothetical protein
MTSGSIVSKSSDFIKPNNLQLLTFHITITQPLPANTLWSVPPGLERIDHSQELYLNKRFLWPKVFGDAFIHEKGRWDSEVGGRAGEQGENK